MLDMTASIAPNSDQLNADDLITGPITVTIDRVTENNSEQPFNFHLVEYPGRPYRPSKSMRRVIVAAWGKDATQHAGKRLTLYRNPDITFGRDTVGGIEISHMSHIDAPIQLSLSIKRGKRKNHKVSPLPDAPAVPSVTVADVEACEDVDQLRAWWQDASDDVKAAITARANSLADQQAAADTSEGELVQGELIEDES